MSDQVELVQGDNEEVQVVDHVHSWVWQMADMQGILPPFCVELTLHDGNRFSVHSIPEKDDATQSLVLRVWDFRSFDEDEMRELRDTVNAEGSRADLADTAMLHPKLDYADVRLHLGNINYAIEWNDNVWPREERPQFGLIPPG